MINFAELADVLSPAGYTESEKQAVAKQLGFKSAEEMLAFERQKQMKRPPSTVAKPGGPTQSKPKPQVEDRRGFFQVIQDALAGKVGPS